jgi:hypothetical protein
MQVSPAVSPRECCSQEHSRPWDGKMLFGFGPANCAEHFVRPASRQANFVFGCQKMMCTEHGLELAAAPDVLRCVVERAR